MPMEPRRNISRSIKALRFPPWSVVQKKITDREAFGITCRARLLAHCNNCRLVQQITPAYGPRHGLSAESGWLAHLQPGEH
jgi:hypothetical protein